RVRGLDDRAHLLGRHRAAQPARDVRQHAAGRRELDDLRAQPDLAAHRATTVVGAVAHVQLVRMDRIGPFGGQPIGAVAMPAADRDHLPGVDDAWPRHVAALDRVARTVNLYVASGVPLKNLKFVAVAYGEATPLVLNDAQYRAKFGVANPNLPLVEQLRKAGVDVSVCAQAVAEHDFQDDWVDKSVTLALSGLTTVTTLEHDGYVLMPL
ncbi:hypothetical protein LTR94_027152, partial [Friedmanniomyces endolithicus]